MAAAVDNRKILTYCNLEDFDRCPTIPRHGAAKKVKDVYVNGLRKSAERLRHGVRLRLYGERSLYLDHKTRLS